jgi:hypothetical protein
LRRHDRFAGYVYTEFADVEHEAAGLLDAWRQPKEWGGVIPSDVNADTVLVLDLVPRAAGADIEPPVAGLELSVQVSHHGPERIAGRVHATWVRAGHPITQLPPMGETASETVSAEPYVLSEATTVTVPPRSAAGRLLLWLSDHSGTVLARAFLDAAEVEPPNRRGARTA